MRCARRHWKYSVHAQQAIRAIGTHAGQNYAHCVRPSCFGDGGEHNVDRRPLADLRIVFELHPMTVAALAQEHV